MVQPPPKHTDIKAATTLKRFPTSGLNNYKSFGFLAKLSKSVVCLMLTLLGDNSLFLLPDDFSFLLLILLFALFVAPP